MVEQTCSHITEAEGDQPGSIATLYREAIDIGFIPLVLGSIKGYLNTNPSEADMRYWAERNGISLAQVTAFTDGTKVQVEQVHVANGLGADILKQGLMGPESDSHIDGALRLAEIADNTGVGQ